MATRSSHKQATSTSRAAGSPTSRQAHAADVRLLEELLAQLPVGLLVNDADTLEVVHVKPPLPGLADGDLPLDRLLRSCKPDDDDPHLGHELASRIQEVAATGTPQHLPEFRHEPSARESRWWSATLHRLDTDRWGRVVITVAVDLTDQVRARHLLADRDARHRTLWQSIASVPGPNLVTSLQRVTEALVPALPVEVATIRLLDEDGNLHLVAASGLRRNETRRLALEPISARRLETMIKPTPPSLLPQLGLHSVEVRRLESGDMSIGSLTTAARSTQRLSEENLALLDTAAVALSNALETIERSARTLRSRSLQIARLSANDIEPAGIQANDLRPRELAILRLYREGLSTHQIAELLVLSPHTIRTHVRNARRRLNVNSRREALDLLAATDVDPVI